MDANYDYMPAVPEDGLEFHVHPYHFMNTCILSAEASQHPGLTHYFYLINFIYLISFIIIITTQTFPFYAIWSLLHWNINRNLHCEQADKTEAEILYVLTCSCHQDNQIYLSVSKMLT